MNLQLSKALFDEQTKHLSGRVLEVRRWVVNAISYPTVDISFTASGRKNFRVRMICKDYNEKPPSIEFLHQDGSYIMTTPTGHGVINGGQHNNTLRPFMCSPGSLEYHTHPSHVNDLWENYKNQSGFDLGGILTQLFYAWQKTTDVA